MKSPSVCGILFLCLGTGVALAQQDPQLGPETFVSIQSLALDEKQAVYAGSFGRGIFKSEDGGKTWLAINEGLTDSYVPAKTALSDPIERSSPARYGAG